MKPMELDFLNAKYARRTSDTPEVLFVPVLDVMGNPVATCTIPAVLLEHRVDCYCYGNGDVMRLRPRDFLNAADRILAEREAIRKESPKTVSAWGKSGLDIRDYLVPGDEVDQSIVDYFCSLAKPCWLQHGYIQAGEPLCVAQDGDGNWQIAYFTFYNQDCKWVYAGRCFEGQKENRVDSISRLEIERSEVLRQRR